VQELPRGGYGRAHPGDCTEAVKANRPLIQARGSPAPRSCPSTSGTTLGQRQARTATGGQGTGHGLAGQLQGQLLSRGAHHLLAATATAQQRKAGSTGARQFSSVDVVNFIAQHIENSRQMCARDEAVAAVAITSKWASRACVWLVSVLFRCTIILEGG
jgi:hypothetical protein